MVSDVVGSLPEPRISGGALSGGTDAHDLAPRQLLFPAELLAQSLGHPTAASLAPGSQQHMDHNSSAAFDGEEGGGEEERDSPTSGLVHMAHVCDAGGATGEGADDHTWAHEAGLQQAAGPDVGRHVLGGGTEWIGGAAQLQGPRAGVGSGAGSASGAWAGAAGSQGRAKSRAGHNGSVNGTGSSDGNPSSLAAVSSGDTDADQVCGCCV